MHQPRWLYPAWGLQEQSSAVPVEAPTDCGSRGAVARSLSHKGRFTPGARARQASADEVKEQQKSMESPSPVSVIGSEANETGDRHLTLQQRP